MELQVHHQGQDLDLGYKAQVAETVQEQPRAPGEPTANFLTAIVTQNATASDKPGMAEVLTEQHATGLDAPSSLYVERRALGN